MTVVGLGWRTDLMLRRLAGARITDRETHLLVRTPGNPDYRWGNFLLLPTPPPPKDTPRWIAAFAAEFPTAAHIAIGIDGPAAPDAISAFAAAGLADESHTVLTATESRRPARPNRAAVCRPLATDADWAQALRLRLAVDPDPRHRRFHHRRFAEIRELCRAGHGVWFGAFLDGQPRSGLGVVTDGGGLARFQHVETHPSYRNRGLAGTLVHHASRHALTRLGAETLVIVADPDYLAIRVYRSLGFADHGRQIRLLRVHRG
jgi:ribosomal protein S18 acetylase RimI-like enzyme